MTVWSRRKRDPAVSTTEIIQWMQKHTIGDLKELAADTEQRGGDASSLRRLLTDLQVLRSEQAELVDEEYHMLPK
ncbi:MAG: hypothetical protein QW505_04270 [Thermoplasmata archaeon]